MVDTARLSGERLADFELDREESNRRYDHAFEVVRSRTSRVELDEFWRLFSAPSMTLAPHADATSGTPVDAEEGIKRVAGIRKKRSHFGQSNPMFQAGVSAMEGSSLGAVYSSARKASTFGVDNPFALAGNEANEPAEWGNPLAQQNQDQVL